MVIYKDIITGDVMFSDTYKIKDNGIIFEVEGKMVTRTDDIDDTLLAYLSREEAAEAQALASSSSVSGVDIVLDHTLQETCFDKSSFIAYIKEYMNTIKDRLEESNPERVKPFMDSAQDEVKKILGNLEKYRFFLGKSENPNGTIGMLDIREDGITPFMIFFKDGLQICDHS